jgi:hypothetical protein
MQNESVALTDKTTILACDVLNQALSAGMPPITDADIMAECPGCHAPISLDQSHIIQTNETAYLCRLCGNTIVIIGPPNPDGKPWPGRGYRINDFLVRNATDLFFNGVKMTKSPNALAKINEG